MMRFTPVCGVGALPGCEDEEAAQDVPATIFLDITGCERVFGGIANLVGEVIASLARLRLSNRVAVAPTPGAAWALADGGSRTGVIVREADVPTALAPLPVSALRLPEEIVRSLYHLGVNTIGALSRLPRAQLPARFDPALLLRLDQAMGHVAEPLVPLPHRSPVEAKIEFDGVVDAIESLWLALGELVDRIISELTRRGLGARQVEAEFIRPDAPPIRKTIDLSRPSRDRMNLFNLLRCAMETIGMGETALRSRKHRPKPRDSADQLDRRNSVAAPAPAPARSIRRERYTPDGFTALRLRVPVFERLTEEQILLLEQDAHAGRLELDHLIERLRARLGREAVVRPELVESHLPERAVKDEEPEQRKSSPAASLEAYRWRPLRLLASPVPVRVMASVWPEGDGRPVSLELSGTSRPLTHAVGPERLGGVWWEGHTKTRDYYDVEDTTGHRFWIFRVAETGRWFLHGRFE